MKLQINNFGPVKGKQDYQIDLTKQFTLVTGANGLGKTYLSYLVYGIFGSFRLGKLNVSKIGKSIVNEIKINDVFELDITLDIFKYIVKTKFNHFREHIHNYMGIERAKAEQIFDNLEIELLDIDRCYEFFVTKEYNINIDIEEQNLLIKKESKSSIVTLKPEKKENVNRGYLIDEFLYYFYPIVIFQSFEELKSPVIYIPVERNSIYTFIKELSKKRSELVSKMQELFLSNDKDENSLPDVLKKSSNRYPEAIEDVMRDAQDLSQLSKEEAEDQYVQLALEIEEDILGGKVLVNSEGEVEFSPERSKKANIPVHMSASFIKTISSLIFFLKHKAKKGDLLMIDEPEMNLHPNMLIKLTRIFAKMCNAGIKLWISTHSDYIISEINNLIMVDILNKKKLKEETEKWGYKTNEYLDKEQMQVLYLNGEIAKTQVKIQNLPITDMGINIKSIDTTLDDLNERTNELTELYYNLEEE